MSYNIYFTKLLETIHDMERFGELGYKRLSSPCFSMLVCLFRLITFEKSLFFPRKIIWLTKLYYKTLLFVIYIYVNIYTPEISYLIINISEKPQR